MRETVEALAGSEVVSTVQRIYEGAGRYNVHARVFDIPHAVFSVYEAEIGRAGSAWRWADGAPRRPRAGGAGACHRAGATRARTEENDRGQKHV